MRTAIGKRFANHGYLSLSLLAIIVCLLASSTSFAQSTAFTHQGKLSEASNPASGQYDFQFKLYDSQTVGTGTQQGSIVPVSNATVTNGIFTVQLDFGACASCFDGSVRFLEIAVKQSANYIQNTTAQQALSNFNISGTGSAGVFNATTQYNISGSRILTVSGNNTNLFAGIGAGAANTSSFNNAFFGRDAGGSNTSGWENTFFGMETGKSNTTGCCNAFFGAFAGKSNVTGIANSFFGIAAGEKNTAGFNSFFGNGAGYENTTGSANSFFGTNARQVTGSVSFSNSNVFLGLGAGEVNAPNGTNGIRNTFVGNNAGAANTTGFANSFFGALAGAANISGDANSFFGRGAGQLNETGGENTFFGAQAGSSNIGGSRNTYIGSAAGGSDALTNSSAFGYRAFATQSDSLILGSISGVNGATADTKVGIGTPSPAAPLHLQRNGIPSDNWQSAQLRISGATDANMQLNIGYDTTANRGVIQAGHANLAFKDLLLNPFGGNVSIGTTNPESLLHVKGSTPVRVLADLLTLSGSEYVDFMARNSGFSSDLGGMRIHRQTASGNVDTLIFAAPSGSSAAEMMRISGNGNVGIGVVAPTFQLQLSSDSAAKPNGGSWSNPSDFRLKENIRSFADGLSVLLKINPVTYRLNGKAGLPKGAPGIGVIAQEVRDLLPYTITTFKAKLEAGDTEPAELLAFNSSALTFVLINAVRELSAQLDALQASSKQAEVEALKRENETQKQRIADLDARLGAMEQMMKRFKP